MEVTWKHYSAIKQLMEKHGMLDGNPEKYDAVIRELLEILGL